MGTPRVTHIKVVRYAPDGGYAAIEWLRAFRTVEFPPTLEDGQTLRIGVQITKKRAVDVVLRIERLESFTDRLRGRLNRTQSDALFKNRAQCVLRVPSTSRPLAVLSAVHMGSAIRILVCAPIQVFED